MKADSLFQMRGDPRKRRFSGASLVFPIALCAGIFLGGFPQAALPLDIYQGPLIADKPMDPNVVYILDDSGSMMNDYMPDEAPSGGTLRKSAALNRQYYNPEITYQPPFRYESGKLVRMKNSDAACPSTATQLRALKDGYVSQTDCYTSFPNAAVYTAANAYSGGSYYDYVPGYNTRRDHPTWNSVAPGFPKTLEQLYREAYSDDALRNDPYGFRFELYSGGYEYWAFREAMSGAYFRASGNNPVPGLRNQAYNKRAVQRRACPRVFNDVMEARAYYKAMGVTQPNLKYDPKITDPNDKRSQPYFGIPTATCRYSARIWDVDEPGNIQGYGTHEGYYSTEATQSPFDGSTKTVPPQPNHAYRPNGRPWCDNSRYTAEAIPWKPYNNSSGVLMDVNYSSGCTVGRHRIGDTIGNGSFSGADDALVADNINSAVCQRDINCFDQSLPHLVSTYVDDDGNLAEYPQKQRRTRKDEIRNFANWYSYYRTRAMAARAGTSLAFAQLVNPGDTKMPSAIMGGKYIRLGYDTIGRMTDRGPGQTSGTVAAPNFRGRGVVPFRDFPNDAVDWQGYPIPADYRGKTFVKDFYDWILNITFPSGTPLIHSIYRMGSYYETAAPWKEYPPSTYVLTNPPGNGGSGNEYGCRRSFGILMTDGYYTDSRSGAGDADGTAGPTNISADGTKVYTYKPEGPFFGQHARYEVKNSLADWAMHYWKRDLRPNTPNRVTPTSKDPAFWQHMQLFTVGLGVQGRLSDTEVNAFLENPDPKQNILWTYPTGLDTDYEKIDDLMHAGLNGHGGTAAAEDPDQFVRKLSNLLTGIAGDMQTVDRAGGGEGNMTISAEEVSIVPAYDPAEWTGDLSAFKLCSDKGKNPVTGLPPDFGKPVLSYDGRASLCGKDTIGQKLIPKKWSAQNVMAEKIRKNPGYWKTRKIFTWDGSQGVRFDTGLSASVKSALDSGKIERSASGGVVLDSCPMPRAGAPASACMLGKSKNKAYTVEFLIDYLRGDASLEDTTYVNANAPVNGFRSREVSEQDPITKNTVKKRKLLGDTVNPAPYLLGAYEFNDYGFGGFRCGAGGTSVSGQPACKSENPASFLKSGDIYNYQRRILGFREHGRDKTVFAAMNDGMLHAFDIDTGEERFAYIPQTLHAQLKQLADADYSGQKHRFFMDGAPFVSDVLLNGTWHSVLAGSTGRGGRGFFALDVEDVQNFDASNVLWEFTNADDGDLGVPADGEPVIAPVAGLTKHWAVTFGNGYNGDSQDACLFVVSLDAPPTSGAKPAFTKLCTHSGGASTPNGLGTPYLLDVNKDGMADYAFAGDLRGNVWQFNLRTLAESDVTKVLEATDSAGRSQAFAAPPAVMRKPNKSIAATGFQVVVGSGKFIEQDDVKQEIVISQPGVLPVKKQQQIQALYGVHMPAENTDIPDGNGGFVTWTTKLGIPVTATRANLLEHVYTQHLASDRFTTRIKDSSGKEIVYSFEGWKSDNKTLNYADPSNPYRGYLLNLNGANMGATLVRAQGTVMNPQTEELLVPFALPADDPCTSALQGGLIAIRHSTGEWIKPNTAFSKIEKDSNIWRDPKLQGMEEARDSKFVKADGVSATYGSGADVQSYTFNQPGGARFGSGDHDAKRSRYGQPPGEGRPSGRQSWTQIR
ncbi:MAG: hypothetical protein LBG69_05755 [Zoogloeaceae bacterium]|jgi:hypothetical protein|nr:hypothetical protein [Zoogloeaceae bacterium]